MNIDNPSNLLLSRQPASKPLLLRRGAKTSFAGARAGVDERRAGKAAVLPEPAALSKSFSESCAEHCEESGAKAVTRGLSVDPAEIDWSQFTDVKRSEEGTTGVFFLYFNDELIPRLCLKLPSNPYSEHFASMLYREVGLNTPQTALLSRDSDSFSSMSSQIQDLILAYEDQKLYGRSDRLYSLQKVLEGGDTRVGDLLLMECVIGKNLEEVRMSDWSSNAMNSKHFFETLGRGLVTDAFILNGDRYPSLFADNLGNFRIAYDERFFSNSSRGLAESSRVSTEQPLCFIDQSVDALRDKMPLLTRETLLQKFEQLLELAYPISDKREIEGESISRGVVDTLVNIVSGGLFTQSKPIERSEVERAFYYNEIKGLESLESIVEEFCDILASNTRYIANPQQKRQFQEGIKEGFKSLAENLSVELVESHYGKLPSHHLSESIPLDLIKLNLDKLREHMVAYQMNKSDLDA